MKRNIALLLALLLTLCGVALAEADAQPVGLEDGVYNAEFTTDSSMFHVNEAYGDIGTLTVRGIRPGPAGQEGQVVRPQGQS